MSSPEPAEDPRSAPAAGLAERIRPRALAGEQVLPVLPAFQDLLPWGGLARGVTVRCRGAGATSLALGLAAAATAAGSWLAAVGLSWLGLAAAERCGVVLGRMASVDLPNATGPTRTAEVVAALVGSVDLVLLCPPTGLRAADARRLTARCRERGTTLVVCDRPMATSSHASSSASVWPEGPDVCLTANDAHWVGLGDGHGHLQARRVRVEATGRRRAARPRAAELWLPGPDGRIVVVEPTASVTSLSRRHVDSGVVPVPRADEVPRRRPVPSAR